MHNHTPAMSIIYKQSAVRAFHSSSDIASVNGRQLNPNTPLQVLAPACRIPTGISKSLGWVGLGFGFCKLVGDEDMVCRNEQWHSSSWAAIES